MTRAALIAWKLFAIAAAEALASVMFISISWGAALPDNWGFRGYPVLSGLAFATTGAIVASRRPANRIGWLLLGAGVLAAFSGLVQEYATYGILLHPGSLPGALPLAWVGSWIWLGYMCSLLFVLLLFPDGRLPSKRWRPVAAAVAVVISTAAISFAIRPGPLENFTGAQNPFGATGAAAELRGSVEALILTASILAFAACAAAPLDRVRRAGPTERQQLKWFGYAAGVLAVSFAFLIGTGVSKLGQVLTIMSFTSLPIAIAVAVLRHRLYDIDLLIRRTLVYGVVSTFLLATYVAFVVVLQTILRPFTAGSELAVAGSTLVVVALFQPIRARVREIVDRRFYRGRYDAARTLDAFAAGLRGDVDIDSIRRDLDRVIHETVRPAHASVWLRGTER